MKKNGTERRDHVLVIRISTAAAMKSYLWCKDGRWPAASLSAPAHTKSGVLIHTHTHTHPYTHTHTHGVAKGPAV